MSIRTALLVASSVTLLAVAIPASAQNNRYEAAVQEAADGYEAARVAERAAQEAERLANRDRRRAERQQRRISRGDRQHEMHHQSGPRLAYSQNEREAWLADCRIVMRGSDYYDQARYEDDDDNGGLLGGLLGAVVGGVAGNRIGGAGDRLAGTLIGAGVGGIAGAMIGSVISGDNRDDERSGNYAVRADDAYAANYCAAYLRRYEASGQAGFAQQAVYVQPMMMVPTGDRHRQGQVREVIREEWVDVAEEPREIRTRHRAAPRRAAPEPGKLTPLN